MRYVGVVVFGGGCMGWWIEAAKRTTMVTYRSNEVFVRLCRRKYIGYSLEVPVSEPVGVSRKKESLERKSWRESLGWTLTDI
jgi:hypothetical protein